MDILEVLRHRQKLNEGSAYTTTAEAIETIEDLRREVERLKTALRDIMNKGVPVVREEHRIARQAYFHHPPEDSE